LIYLEINFKIYAKQILKNVTVSFLQDLKKKIEQIIFIKNDVKIYLNFIKKIRVRYKFKEFNKNWSSSSSDLNSIEKIWRWMKTKIIEIKLFSITINEFKAAVQALWDEMNSCMFICHIESTSEKLWEVYRQQDYNIKY